MPVIVGPTQVDGLQPLRVLQDVGELRREQIDFVGSEIEMRQRGDSLYVRAGETVGHGHDPTTVADGWPGAAAGHGAGRSAREI